MSCGYCSGIGVVGGVMPWNDGPGHAVPCPHCTSSPALKFKPGVTPWSGVVHPVPEIEPGKPSWSLFAEPYLSGSRMVVTIDEHLRANAWCEDGSQPLSELLVQELQELASQIAFDGFLGQFACGVAFEGIMHDDTLMLYMAVPLLCLLNGHDKMPMSQRRLDLLQATKAVGGALSYSMMPRSLSVIGWELTCDKLERACIKLGVERVMIKCDQSTWGSNVGWFWYRQEEDF